MLGVGRGPIDAVLPSYDMTERSLLTLSGGSAR